MTGTDEFARLLSGGFDFVAIGVGNGERLFDVDVATRFKGFERIGQVRTGGSADMYDVRFFLCQQFGVVGIDVGFVDFMPLGEGFCSFDIHIGDTNDGCIGKSLDAAYMKFGNLSCSDDADLECLCRCFAQRIFLIKKVYVTILN